MKIIKFNFMFKKMWNIFLNTREIMHVKYLYLKSRAKFYFSLISDPNTRESGAFPIAAAWAVVWAAAQIGAMIWAADKVAKFVEGDTKFFESILAAIAAFLTEASQAWVEMATGALDMTVKSFLTANITGTATSLAGWMLIRDLANMFIVLGFVFVGIAFALRLESYGSKKVLTSLIMVALLINFSPLICGIIIDASNILITFLLQSANPNGMIMEFKGLTKNMIDSILASQPSAANNVHTQLGISMTVLFTNLLIIVSFFTYAIMLLARYVMLSVLFMFSPLAFVCYVFPFSQKYAQMWWDNFLKWCFVGAIGFFFIWFASKMLAFWETTPEPWGIYHVLVIFVILMAGYKFTKSTSAMGASMAIGLVTGAAGTVRGKVTGSAKKLGGWGMQKLNGEKGELGKSVNSVVGRTMERLGLQKTGTTAAANNERVEKEAKLIANEYSAAKATGNTTTVDKIRSWAKNERGVRGAAAMKVVADAKDLHKAFDNGAGGINLPAAAARLSYAESVGAKDIIKEQEKLMPGLKGQNDVAVNEEWNRNNAAGTRIYPQNNAGRASATREVIRKQHAGMTVSDMRNLPDSQMGLEFVNDSNYGTFARASLEFTTEQKDKLKSLLPVLKSQTLSGLGLPPNATVGQVRSAITALKASPNLANQERAKRMEESANKYLLIKD